MDTTPPQAPPAQSQAAHEAAVSAFDRIVTAHARLVALQASMPAPPATLDMNAGRALLADLAAFWTPGQQAELTIQLATAMRDLATLSGEDRTLSPQAAALARAITSTRGAALPAGVDVRELVFAGVVHAGSLVATDRHQPDMALLFDAQTGWEAFSSLDVLYATVEQRARRRMAEDGELRGMTRADARRGGPGPWVSSQTITGDALDTYVGHIVALQRAKIEQAAFEWALAEAGEDRDIAFGDRLLESLDLRIAFDHDALLAARHARLVHAVNETRLAGLPDDVAKGWREAEDDYASLLRSLPSDAPPPHSLAAYATDAIARRLATLGVSLRPDEITIEGSYDGDPAARAASLQALFEGTPTVRFRLLDLAYQNISALDLVRLRAVDAQGSAITRLDDATVRAMVRELDLATAYTGYLTDYYRTGPEAGARRADASHAWLARMRLHAAEARLASYQPGAPRTFLEDRTERGFHWVEAVLDSPAAEGRRMVDGHPIVARQVTYLGTPLDDIVEIGSSHDRSVPNVVLYTPDAPDGIAFREFEDRAEAGRKFFYHPAFREYLLDRLPNEYARTLPNGSVREFAGSRLASWVLGGDRPGSYTLAEAPFVEKAVQGDIAIAAVETATQRALRNVGTFTRSAQDAHWAWLVGWPRQLLFDNLIANAVKGAVYAPAHAAQAAWRLYDDIKAGDSAAAFVDFTEFYVASLSVVAPHAFASAAGRATVAARFRSGGKLVEGRRVAQVPVTFESRFEATSVRRAGLTDADGLLSIQGHRYIEQNGKLYRVRYDNDYATWRLQRPEASGHAWGPAVQRTHAGTWAYRDVGLRGGSGRGAPARTGLDVFDEYLAELEIEFPDPVVRDLVVSRMREEITGQVAHAGVTATQRAGWEAAATRARDRVNHRPLLGPAQATPLNLTRQVPNAPWFIRRVDPAAAPTELWHYGSRPFRDSQLVRQPARTGFHGGWAALRADWFGPGFHGVPVTTLPPTAPLAELRAAMGNPTLVPHSTFAVRISPQSALRPLPHLGGATTAELMAVDSAGGTQLYLRPSRGTQVDFSANEFQVFSDIRLYPYM